MTEYFNRVPQKDLRRHLRAETTAAERLLWGKLSRKQLPGMSFRRQYSVGRYVLDFYCAQAKLGVELDGRTHSTPDARGARNSDEFLCEALCTKRKSLRKRRQKARIMDDSDDALTP